MAGSAWSTVGFATAVCVVCATVVSSSAVLLRDRQRANEELDRRRNVLVAAGVVAPDEALSGDEIQARFGGVTEELVDLRSGRPQPADAEAPDPEGSATVFLFHDEAGVLEKIVLPVEGPGLWSTLYGFLCLRADLETICGLSFHRHGETPGLGGEIDDPRWQARWVDRRAFGPDGKVRIEVAKGPVGPPQEDPFRVDGISGATITCRGVTSLVQHWLGEQGFGPYLRFVADEEER